MKTKMMLLVAGLLLIGGNLFAADGDLIVNGNLGVGTATPTQKLDVNGNVKGTGLCIGSNCTSTLHVSGGLYGQCTDQPYGGPCSANNPASCATGYCSCPAGYTRVTTGYFFNASDASTNAWYSCYKN